MDSSLLSTRSSPPPTMPDFQMIFKSSFESIKGSVYSSLFDDLSPTSDLCDKNAGSDFSGIAEWFKSRWRAENTSDSELTQMCRAYERDCLMNTNWTFVNNQINKGNLLLNLRQFCPQPQSLPISSRTSENWDPSVHPTIHLPTIITSNKLPNTSGVLITKSQPLTSNHNESMSTTDQSYQPNNPESSAQLDNPYKYLGFIGLLLPILSALIIIVVILKRKRDRKIRKKPMYEYSDNTMSSAPSLQSFPATPTSQQNLVFPDKSEKKKQRRKKKVTVGSFPRQVSTDSNSSVVYFANIGEAMPADAVDGDREKKEMMENWKYQLETLAEMLTRSDTTIDVVISNETGQEDC